MNFAPKLKRKLVKGEKVRCGFMLLSGEREGVVIENPLLGEPRVLVTFLPEDEQTKNPHIVSGCLALERSPTKNEELPASHWQYCYPIPTPIASTKNEFKSN